MGKQITHIVSVYIGSNQEFALIAKSHSILGQRNNSNNYTLFQISNKSQNPGFILAKGFTVARYSLSTQYPSNTQLLTLAKITRYTVYYYPPLPLTSSDRFEIVFNM